MPNILKRHRNQLIIQRNQAIKELNLKYTHYIMQLFQQQTIIKMNIQRQYDQQIHWIESQLNTYTQLMDCSRKNHKITDNNDHNTYQMTIPSLERSDDSDTESDGMSETNTSITNC